MANTIAKASAQKFFASLLSRDPQTRRLVLDEIERKLRGWCFTNNHTELGTSPTNSINSEQSEGDHENLLNERLPIVLRLSKTCPFDDVRSRCRQLLDEFENQGVRVPNAVSEGPSYFLDASEVVGIDTDNEETARQFVEAFLHNNRLENVVQVMGYHPQYLDAFQKTQQFLLRGDGPLPHEYRHYIAIMASARHYCNYLVKLHTCEFIMQGGDPEWLEGLDKCPKKLQDLNELNRLMAHRPWLIKDSHIKDLTSGQRKWTLSEVMHAVVLLAHFHSLSSFVYGCGVSPELDDSDGGYTFYRSKEDGSTLFHPSSSSDPEVNGVESNNEEKPIKVLMESMRQLHENPEASVEEKVKAFESIDPAFDKSPSPPQSGAHEERQRKEQNAEFMKKFIDNPSFVYEDFSQRDRSNNPTTFRAQDFSWDEQGFSLTNRLYPDLGQYLDEKFKIATTLTYYTMGNNSDVDTTAFRRAIWNYIHCMFGIRHDDYDYREVNVLLERSLKQYIKTITCYPEKVTRNDFKVFMKDFKQSEKVHVNLMLLEARLQGELLYALNAITRFMT